MDPRAQLWDAAPANRCWMAAISGRVMCRAVGSWQRRSGVAVDPLSLTIALGSQHFRRGTYQRGHHCRGGRLARGQALGPRTAVHMLCAKLQQSVLPAAPAPRCYSAELFAPRCVPCRPPAPQPLLPARTQPPWLPTTSSACAVQDNCDSSPARRQLPHCDALPGVFQRHTWHRFLRHTSTHFAYTTHPAQASNSAIPACSAIPFTCPGGRPLH